MGRRCKGELLFLKLGAFSGLVFSALEARLTFFLRRQEESKQRRRRPWVGAPFGGSLRYSKGRAAAELGATPLKQSSPTAPGPPALLSASQGDPKGVRAEKSARAECYGQAEKRLKFEISRLGHGWFSGPLERRRVTQALAEKGRGLSEGRRPEFRSPRQRRVTQGTGEAGADPGSPFLCLLSFGEAKESKTRLKRGKPKSRKGTKEDFPNPV